MNHIEKIRAALEQAGEYIRSDLASERGAFEGHEGVSRIDEIKADLANNKSAIAALAELERAAAEPVAWMWEDMLGISHTYVSPKRPTWPDAGASPEMAVAINVRPLYAAPPALVAAAPQFVASEVDDAMCERVSVATCGGGEQCRASRDWARRWLEAWRSELGLALGLVELREPSDDQCRAIADEFLCNVATASRGVRTGRAMIAAVRSVMWPKSEVL